MSRRLITSLLLVLQTGKRLASPITTMTHEANVAENPTGTRMYHVGIGLAILTTTAVLLRLLARWKTKAKFDIDDYLVVISLLPFYVMTILSYIGVYLWSSVNSCKFANLHSGQQRTFWTIFVRSRCFRYQRVAEGM